MTRSVVNLASDELIPPTTDRVAGIFAVWHHAYTRIVYVVAGRVLAHASVERGKGGRTKRSRSLLPLFEYRFGVTRNRFDVTDQTVANDLSVIDNCMYLNQLAPMIDGPQERERRSIS